MIQLDRPFVSTALASLLLGCSATAAQEEVAATPAPAAAAAETPEPDETEGFDPERFEGWHWREVGPYRGGRSAAVCGIPAERDTYYMGTAGGGVWKTTDGGRSWENVSDGTFGGSIGAVAVSEWDPNVIYVGGGEKTVRGNVSHGDGVWKSTDAGRTWMHVGLSDTRRIPRIRVHPRDPDTAYVAALGHLFGPNEERGVFRTTDGGATWEKVLYVSEHAGCVDLALDPTNPRILYASFWRVLRQPWTLESGGEGSGLWKSTDGGDTWTEITQNPGLPQGVIGISGVSVSRSNPDNLYAIVEAEKGGVFRSRDGGETWSLVNKERKLRQRAWYYTRLYADPTDESIVYVLNVGFHRSVDGGKTFTSISVPHGDNHDLWIDPADPLRLIQSNDGGSNVSYDGGRTWTPQDNQPTAQMYRVSVDDDFPYRLLGGQQDNSALRLRSRSLRSGSIGVRDWEPTAGGESGHIVAQPGRPDRVYGGSYGGTLMWVDHATGERRSVHVWPDNPMGWGAAELRYRFQWNFPLFFSPHDPGVLYAAANVLFRTRDGGASWEEISPDLTRDDEDKQGPSGGPITKDNTGVEYYCTIFAAFESPHEAGVIWCGSDDGLVHLSRDDGATWTDVTPAGLPEWTQVNDLVPHPTEPGGAYLAGTRYKLDDFRPYLYRTTDYGATWTAITDGIGDDHFTRAIAPDPGRAGLVYAGTERGVYVSFDDGGSWTSLQLDLPIVPVTDLEVVDGDLVVATQGRGYWILDDLSPLHRLELAGYAGATLFEPRAALRLSARRSSEPRGAGTNPLGGAVISYLLPDDLEDDAEIRLEILSADGSVIREFTPKPPEGQKPAPLPPTVPEDPRRLPTEPGFNRFAWNLRHPGAEKVPKMILWAGSLAGPRVAPGLHRARLTVGEQTFEEPFQVVPDPRSSATPEDYAEQLTFLLQVRDDLTATHGALRELRDLRAQLKDVSARLAGDEAFTAVVEGADAIAEDLTAIEEALYQTKIESRQDPLNFPIRLGDKLAGLRSSADMGDFAPTAQQHAVRGELWHAIEAEIAKLDSLRTTDLPAFEELCREAGVPVLRPMKQPQADEDDEAGESGD